MRKAIIIIVTICSLISGYGQTKPTSEPNLKLTEKNLKYLFSLKPDICCPAPQPEWISCNNTENNYATSDTIKLYSNSYYYLSSNRCYTTSWIFSNSTSFNIVETNVCNEPPISSVNTENCGLKIKFDKSENSLLLSIYKNKILKDKFKIISLNYIEIKNDEHTYELTMLRL